MAILLADLDKDSYSRVEGPGLTGIERPGISFRGEPSVLRLCCLLYHISFSDHG